MGIGKGTVLIQDPRQVKKPSAAFIHYAKDQYRSGREITKGENGKPSVVSFTKTLRNEFANIISPEEKKVCCVLYFFPLPGPSAFLLLVGD